MSLFTITFYYNSKELKNINRPFVRPWATDWNYWNMIVEIEKNSDLSHA